MNKCFVFVELYDSVAGCGSWANDTSPAMYTSMLNTGRL
jgi:hypothetical protein